MDLEMSLAGVATALEVSAPGQLRDEQVGTYRELEQKVGIARGLANKLRARHLEAYDQQGGLVAYTDTSGIWKRLMMAISSKYPPIMFYIQIGRIWTRNRFIVTSLLKSSPILLGTDFTVNNIVSAALFRNNEWFVTIGSLDKPRGGFQLTLQVKLACAPPKMLIFLHLR